MKAKVLVVLRYAPGVPVHGSGTRGTMLPEIRDLP